MKQVYCLQIHYFTSHSEKNFLIISLILTFSSLSSSWFSDIVPAVQVILRQVTSYFYILCGPSEIISIHFSLSDQYLRNVNWLERYGN